MSSDCVWHVGIDVSAKKLDVATKTAAQAKPELLTVDNDASGHELIVQHLNRCPGAVRVCLEATGIYGLDLALTLSDAGPRIQVMVANPRSVQSFAKALLTRGKTDPGDAVVLAEFAQRLPFVPWKAPSGASLQLRAVARRCEALTKERVAEKNRLHASKGSEALPKALIRDIEANVAAIERRIDKLELAALQLIKADPELKAKHALLLSVVGIADRSAIRLLAELTMLPTDMDVRQLVAHAGLDPRPYQSGTSVQRQTKISKAGNRHIRNALYMPALTAAQRQPVVRAYYEHLIARGKEPLVALVAVMRKLLHAIHGMLRTGKSFEAHRFFTMPRCEESA